jgi:hypothetical protein
MYHSSNKHEHKENIKTPQFLSTLQSRLEALGRSNTASARGARSDNNTPILNQFQQKQTNTTNSIQDSDIMDTTAQKEISVGAVGGQNQTQTMEKKKEEEESLHGQGGGSLRLPSPYPSLNFNHHHPIEGHLYVDAIDLSNVKFDAEERLMEPDYSVLDFVDQRLEILELMDKKPKALVNTIAMELRNNTTVQLIKLGWGSTAGQIVQFNLRELHIMLNIFSHNIFPQLDRALEIYSQTLPRTRIDEEVTMFPMFPIYFSLMGVLPDKKLIPEGMQYTDMEWDACLPPPLQIYEKVEAQLKKPSYFRGKVKLINLIFTY